MKNPIVVSWDTPECRQTAEQLATALKLTLTDVLVETPPYPYILYMTNERLELRLGDPGSKTKIFAEFLKGPSGYRRARGGGVRQSIARAVGLKSGVPRPSVLDVTAGLGQDAFVLASLGCELRLVERSPIIAALLQDGLKRAEQDPEAGHIVRDRMKVEVADAAEVLASISPNSAPDVVYLDPMFPERQKSALTKIEMRVIREIVGSDEDADLLLLKALKIARRRVVVKRPIQSLPLANLKPNFIVEGRRNRYDVYLIEGKY